MASSPIQKFLFSPTINRIGLFLGELLPARLGRIVIRLVVQQLIKRGDNEQVIAVRKNQWVISDGMLSEQELNERVKQVYISSGISLYDYYHCMRKEKRTRDLIQFDDNLRYFIRRVKSGKENTLGLVLHMGAFDLSGHAIALAGADPLVLAYPNPNPGYQWHNELRRQAGLAVEPLSIESFQKATRHLRSGGTVITGVDRPWPGGHVSPKFFGKPSAIPVTTIQMALRTESPIMLLACVRQPDDRYILHASELIELTRNPDRDVELIENTERVLKIAEEFIRITPEQWAMFYPVWPDVSMGEELNNGTKSTAAHASK
jgi:KDO2-lipid IV(A) lauroyltransferase